MTDGGSPILAMRDIAKDFPGVRRSPASRCDVRAGEVPPCSARTAPGNRRCATSFSGVFTEYGGTIELAGQLANIHHPKDAQSLGIGMIHQELNLVPELSIADNIFLAGSRGPGGAR